MNIDDYEIIIINDCSPDGDWNEIVNLCKKDKKVKGLNLSRNFGQHRAITAGLDSSSGDVVVVMDCDLQDQPEELPKLYEKLKEGYDVVFAKRIDRKDSKIKITLSKIYKKIFNYLADVHLDNTIGNYCIMRRSVVDGISSLRESTRSHTLFTLWLGFDIAYVDIEHAPRFRGKSAYNFWSYLSHTTDIILYQSNAPLKILVIVGIVLSILSILIGVILIYNHIVYAKYLEGWTSIMVTLFFVTGLLMATLGLVGLYIGKIFDEVKGRPIYYVKERVNFES